MAESQHGSSESGLVSPLGIQVSRRATLALGGAGLGAFLLAACGAGGSGSPSAASSGGTPKRGGTLKIAVSDASSADSIDPGLATSTNSNFVVTAIYDQLATLDLAYNAQPALAKSWEVSADAKTWTIHLRDGVTWHDGSPFTSKDVVYTMSRWLNPKTGSAVAGFVSEYFSMAGVSAPDPSTVVLKLSKPNGSLMQTFANLPDSAIVKNGVTDFGKHAIGTGPFKLTSWSPGNGWSAVQNPTYWGGKPYLEGLQATVTPDQSAKVQAALAGSTDVADWVPVSLWPTLMGKSNVVLETIKNRNTWIFAFDQTQAPFNDERVISALKLATDRNAMVQTALLGHGTPVADIPVAPGTAWYPPNVTPEFNVSKAKALLAEAGHPNGINVELSVTSAVAGMLDTAQAWQQIVKPAGINVTLKQYPLDTYWTKAWEATPAFMDIWTNFFPPVGFNAFYTKAATWPETKHSDPALEAAVAELLSTTDPAKQIQLTQKAYEIARDSYGYLIPAFADSAYPRSPRLNGVNPVQGALDFRKAWLA